MRVDCIQSFISILSSGSNSSGVEYEFAEI